MLGGDLPRLGAPEESLTWPAAGIPRRWATSRSVAVWGVSDGLPQCIGAEAKEKRAAAVDSIPPSRTSRSAVTG